jgi:hypothetical protein
MNKSLSNVLKNKKFLFIIVVFILFFNVNVAFGIGEECIPVTNSMDLEIPLAGKVSVDNLGDYLTNIYNYLIYLSGIFAVIMIIIAGFQWVMAGGNESKISGAKERIKNAIIGLILVSSCYLILNIINPDLTKVGMPTVCDIRQDEIGRIYADGFDITSLDQSKITESQRVNELGIVCVSNTECSSQNPDWTCINKKCATKNSVAGICDNLDHQDCLSGLTCVSSGASFGRCQNLTCSSKKKNDSCIYYGIERKPLPGYCDQNGGKCTMCIKPLDFSIVKCQGDYMCTGSNGKCGNDGDGQCSKHWCK